MAQSASSVELSLISGHNFPLPFGERILGEPDKSGNYRCIGTMEGQNIVVAQFIGQERPDKSGNYRFYQNAGRLKNESG
jgi:hypothetical protein